MQRERNWQKAHTRARVQVQVVKSIRLEVDIRNRVAINLYEELDYKVAGIIKGYYSDGGDALVMTKSL